MSKTCNAALGTQVSTEVDLEWKNSPDLMDSQGVFPQKEVVDFFWVRLRVWDPGIANPHYEAVLAFIALD